MHYMYLRNFQCFLFNISSSLISGVFQYLNIEDSQLNHHLNFKPTTVFTKPSKKPIVLTHIPFHLVIDS